MGKKTIKTKIVHAKNDGDSSSKKSKDKKHPKTKSSEEEVITLKGKYSENQYLDELMETLIDGSDFYYHLKIPLLGLPEPRYGLSLSLSDYMIFLTILARNLEGRFFDERNEFFTVFLGIKPAQVESSISKLLKKGFIKYVDENGHPLNEYDVLKKPLTRKEKDKYNSKLKKEDYLFTDPPTNDKREFLAYPFESVPPLARWQTDFYYRSKNEKDEEKKYYKDIQEKEKALRNLLISLEHVHEISIDSLPNYENEDFRNCNVTTWNTIETVLKERGISVQTLFNWVKYKSIFNKF